MKISIAFTVLFVALCTVAAQAQKDLTRMVNTLPAKDATYLIHSERNVFLYAVKQSGRIVSYEAFDRSGQPIAITREEGNVKKGVNKKADDLKAPGAPLAVAEQCTKTVCLGSSCYKVPCTSSQ